MHKIGLHTFTASVLIAIAIPLTAQIAPCQQTAPCPVNPPTPPKWLSFTAEIKIHSEQTLADGTTITHEGKEVQVQDSQGRSFSSRTNPFAPRNSADDAFTWSNANDPVDGTQSNWDSRSRKARVLKRPPRDERHGCWASASGTVSFGSRPPQPPPTTGPSLGIGAGGGSISASVAPGLPIPLRPGPHQQDDLGTAVIMGLEAHGTRITFTTPAGEIGNDRPLVHTTEVWTTPGLLVPLRQITTDPRMGTETSEVIGLDLSEPPLSTFQPPEGYDIQVDEMREVPCPNPTTP